MGQAQSTAGSEVTEDSDLLDAHNARRELFNEILEQLAICDFFSNPVIGPSIFPVYAHKNDTIGVANDDCVHDVIKWLQSMNARILSDKSPVSPLITNEHDALAMRNILSNQIRLLPVPQGNNSKADNFSTTIRKVIVFGSEVLKHYCQTPYALEYIKQIVHLCNCEDNRSLETLESQVQAFVHSQTSHVDFHHVLTEIAFLQVRKHRLSKDHGMVPVALDGAHYMPYLGIFGETDLTLKLNSPTVPARHALFFKIMEQLFVKEKDLINDFKELYNEVIEEIRLEPVGHQTRKQFQDQLNLKITRTYHKHWRAFSTAMRNQEYVAYFSQNKYGPHVLELLEQSKQRERREILQWVSSAQVAHHHGEFQSLNKARVEGTCEWVVQNDKFCQWRNSQESGILSLVGSMGTGKTYATSRVIEWFERSLSRSENDEFFAYFYCIRQDETRHNPTAILRNIVKQVANGPCNRENDNLAIDDAVYELWKQDQKGRFYNRFDDWRDCLFKILDNFPRTTFVLDALDECKESERRYLVDLFTDLTARPSEETTVKIFVSTRPETNLTQWLSKHSSIHIEERNTDDIAAFVNARITHHNEWFNMAQEFREEIIRILVGRTENMFLFASLQLESLLECSFEDDIRSQLEALPHDLREAYTQIYIRATAYPAQKKFADRALRWVMCSTTPLTTDELLLAICYEADADVASRNRRQVDERKIQNLCNNLLRLEDSLAGREEKGPPVWRLAHQAVAEFLEGSAYYNSVLAHREAGELCLRVLIDTFGGDSATSDSDSDSSSEVDYGGEYSRRRNVSLEIDEIDIEGNDQTQSALRQYAIYAWPTHVRAQENSEADIANGLSQTLQRFLGEPEEGSRVYQKWFTHVGRNPVPSWALFNSRHIPNVWWVYGKRMAPITLACHLGIFNTLLEWWNLPELNVNLQFSSTFWNPLQKSYGMIDPGLSWSLIALAYVHEETKICKHLLARGARLSTEEEDQIPPIVVVTLRDAVESAKELLEHDANIWPPFMHRHGHILLFAIKSNSLKVMQMLVLRSTIFRPQEIESILDSLSISDFQSAKMIELLVDTGGVNVNLHLNEAGSLLAIAISHHWEDLVGWLLEKGANTNKQFGPISSGELRHSTTALEMAAASTPVIFHLMLKNGAHVTSRAVGVACGPRGIVQKQPEDLELLLGSSPDLNETWVDHLGQEISALIIAVINAVESGKSDSVRLLIEHGADVNLNVKGPYRNALDAAFGEIMGRTDDNDFYGSSSVIQALAEAGASFENVGVDDPDIALATAAINGLEEMVQIFLDRRADPNACCAFKDGTWDSHCTVLGLAAASSHPQAPHILGLLLKHGANVNAYCREHSYISDPRLPLALDKPLGIMIRKLIRRDKHGDKWDEYLDTWLRSASILIENGAVWDMNFSQWMICLGVMEPEFSKRKAECLEKLEKRLEENRTNFLLKFPKLKFNPRWRIKDPQVAMFEIRSRHVFNSMRVILGAREPSRIEVI